MWALLLLASLVIATPVSRNGINDDVVCCTPQGCEVPLGNGVRLLEPTIQSLPNRTCETSDYTFNMPADGVGFRMVSTYPDEVVNYDCFAELADDPQPKLVLLGLYANGTYTFLSGSGERVGGCVVVDP